MTQPNADKLLPFENEALALCTELGAAIEAFGSGAANAELPSEVIRRALIKANTRPAPRVGDWVCVPRDPTQVMFDAGYKAAAFPRDPEICAAMFKAMCDAADPPPAAGGMKVEDESGWLVELKGNTPKWWCYKFPSSEEEVPDWTPDASKAIRFARREDAQSIIDYYGWTEAFASEHAWCNPLATQPEARPLRELIAEGHKQFWIYRHEEWRFCKLGFWRLAGDQEATRQLIDVRTDAPVGIVGLDILEDYGWNDCPAIPILKPTVTL